MKETVKSYAEYWLSEVDSVRSGPSSVQAHGYVIRNRIVPGLGELALEELTEERVRRFLETLPLNDASRRNVSAVLRQCLRHAVESGLIEENPVPTGLYRSPESVNAYILSPREIRDYLTEAERQNRLPMFHLLLTTGIKPGELVQLRASDLAPRKGLLTIRGCRFRTIPLPPETVQFLRREQERHPRAKLLFLHPGSQNPYTRGELYRYHRRIAEASGLEGVRLCDLRHSYAVNAIREGKDLDALAATLGHRDANDLQKTYLPYLPRQKKRERKAKEC